MIISADTMIARMTHTATPMLIMMTLSTGGSGCGGETGVKLVVAKVVEIVGSGRNPACRKSS